MNFVRTILIVVLISLFFSFLNKKSQSKPEVLNGEVTLRYSALFEILGWMVLVPILIISIGGFVSSTTVIAKLGFIVFFLIFASMGAYLILIRRNSYTKITDQGISNSGIFCRIKEIEWSNIKEVSFSPASKALTISDGKNKISLSTLMTGFTTLVDTLQQKVDPAIVGSLVKDIDKFKQARGF